MAPPKQNTAIGQARTGSFGTASAYGQAIQNIDGVPNDSFPQVPVNALNESGTSGPAALAITALYQQNTTTAKIAAGAAYGTNSPETLAIVAIVRPAP